MFYSVEGDDLTALRIIMLNVVLGLRDSGDPPPGAPPGVESRILERARVIRPI